MNKSMKKRAHGNSSAFSFAMDVSGIAVSGRNPHIRKPTTTYRFLCEKCSSPGDKRCTNTLEVLMLTCHQDESRADMFPDGGGEEHCTLSFTMFDSLFNQSEHWCVRKGVTDG